MCCNSWRDPPFYLQYHIWTEKRLKFFFFKIKSTQIYWFFNEGKYFIHENCGILELEFKNGVFEINEINFHGHLKNPHKKFDFTTDFQDLIKPYDIFEVFYKKKGKI